MKKFNYRSVACLSFLLFSQILLNGQVPVSKEPLHRPVIENKYIRLLDVNMKPGDTSLFHIHAIPSVFLHFTNAFISSQVKGDKWIKEQAVPGKAWFRLFSPDTLIHRVSNIDTILFHVTDIEILSSYDLKFHREPLPYNLLFENDKVFAYRLTYADLNNQIIQDRGPMIAELVSGDDVTFHDIPSDEKREIKAGQYLYIPPGSYFSFAAKKDEKISLVLFEIR
jgi:hypothetical protein